MRPDPRRFCFMGCRASKSTWTSPIAFATMLNGVTSQDLQEQWKDLQDTHPLSDCLRSLASQSVLLVTGDKDDLWPPSHYTDFVARLPNIQWVRTKEGDHAFSTCRPWL